VSFNLVSNLKPSLKNAYFKLAVAIITIAIIGFSTVSNYGLSWDEGEEISMLHWNYKVEVESLHLLSGG